MKPGNLQKQGAKSGGKTRDEDSIETHIESRCADFLCVEKGKSWKKDCLLLNA